MDMKIAELEWEIKQNQSMIKMQARRVFDAVDDLRQMIEANDYDRHAQRDWTDGHVSEDVTKLASLMQKDQALKMALGIIKKGEQ